jgi:hypothetical protein
VILSFGLTKSARSMPCSLAIGSRHLEEQNAFIWWPLARHGVATVNVMRHWLAAGVLSKMNIWVIAENPKERIAWT